MSTGGWRRFSNTLEDITREMRAQKADGRNNRRHGRIRPSTLCCNLGTILDFSASGVRLRTRRAIGGDHVVVLGNQHGRTRIKGRVVWAKRIGLFSHEIGIEFIEINDEQAKVLRDLATL